jgi:hypothetical protein
MKKKPLPPLVARIFGFAFGDQSRVIIWLIALGGLLSVGKLALTIVLIYTLADVPVTSVKVVENLGRPTEVIAQAACAAMLRSGSLSAASMREKASTCM